MSNKDQQIQSLTEQNDDLENYFRNTIITQLFIDANLIFRRFTPAAMKQFKLSPDDIGKSFHDVINNLRFPSIIESIHHVIDTAEVLEKEIQTTDLRWYQMNILPHVKPADNKTHGVIITFIEITARIKELQDLERLIADHETLLDTISHDIKNPLSNLLTSVYLLDNDCLENPKEVKQILKVIENGIRKLHTLLNDLGETRKNQQHKYEAVYELLNLEPIIEDVRLTLLDTINESGSVITSELTMSEIFFSRRKIRSIIYNLVNNAIKFKSPERKPEIFIRTTQEDDFVILSIRDNGIGIDAAKHKDIFEKYYRINDAVEGSGIGLNLVKELVTNAGGKITLESEPGKGTEFTIHLKVK